MDLAQQLTLYNKNLPVRYQLSSLLKRLIYYWSGSVTNSLFPRFSQGLSLTFVKVERESIADWTKLGCVVNPCSKSANLLLKNQHRYVYTQVPKPQPSQVEGLLITEELCGRVF